MDKLSLDAAAARKAGMSYGYFKALHPHTEYDPVKKKRKIECPMCGKLFVSTRNRRYCSLECSDAKRSMDARNRYFAKRGGATA